MPDDRLFHKRLGHSVKVSGLTDLEFRVWIQYQLSADDYGVMRLAALAVQADNASLANRPTKLINRALDLLVAVGLLLKFEHQGQPYVCQESWQNFQKVRYPRTTIHPIPPVDVLAKCTPETRELFQKHFGNVPAGLPKDSGATTEILPESSGETSETLPSRAHAGMANGLRPEATGQQPTAAHGITGGVMSGTLPRDHVNCHQPCIRVCISEKQHAILREKHGGSDADLNAFYAEVRARLDPSVPIGDKPWQFWDAQFSARFGVVASVNPRTAGNLAAARRFAARVRE